MLSWTHKTLSIWRLEKRCVRVSSTTRPLVTSSLRRGSFWWASAWRRTAFYFLKFVDWQAKRQIKDMSATQAHRPSFANALDDVGRQQMLCFVPNKSVQLLGQLVFLFTHWGGRPKSNIHYKFSSQISIVHPGKVEGTATALQGYAQSWFRWFGFHILPCHLPGIHSIPAAPAHRDGTLCLWLLGRWDFWILWLVGVCWYCRSLCFWLNSSRKCSEMRLAVEGN